MYYHKMPLSFNFYLKPGRSPGAAVVYSKLYRVVSEQQLTIKNTQTQEEEVTSKIITAGYTDSFFYKSQRSWSLQSNYQWRRFGFGIRYSMDVEPHIKYTKPTGEMDERKKRELEFFVRFRIWKSK